VCAARTLIAPQVVLGRTMVTYRKRAIAMTEQRASVMGEILRCIRLIKMTAIENSFLDKIQGRRGERVYAHHAA
jgi:ABC-type bacteriocin/lantibiotic exporter with double-glycine peptidase domain